MAGDTHNSVRGLITDLVWMIFTDRLRGKGKVAGSEGGRVSVLSFAEIFERRNVQVQLEPYFSSGVR